MPNGDRFLEGEARTAGMPPWEKVTYAGDATTRRAAWDWLKKLEAYLQEQINQGVMTTSEAASIWQHQHGRLLPEAGWKERKPTAAERTRQQLAGELTVEQITALEGNPIREWIVPKPTELVDLDMYATVKGFYGGLASDRRGQLDEAAQLYADAQQTFTQQQGALPLGRGGDPVEQMWTAQEAIRNLRLRQASITQTRNPYMQSTVDLIDQQIGQLTGAQDKLRELARTQARIAGQAEPTDEWRRPSMPTPRGAYPAGMLEQLPHTAQRYFGGRLGQLWGEFEEARPGARERWWAALHPEPEAEQEPGRSAQAFAAQYGMSPEAAAQTGLRYATAGQRGEFAGLTPQQRADLAGVGMEVAPDPRPRGEPPRDPWEAWMEDYPYMSKFMTVPRQQRGFYPRRSVARGQWFV